MARRSHLRFLITAGMILSGFFLWYLWPASFPQALRAAQEQWNNHHIRSYQLHVTVSAEPHYHADYTLTVRDDRLHDVVCTDSMNNECHDFAQGFTVIGLFNQAQAQYDEQAIQPSRVFAIRFDPIYGFPRRIESHNPAVFDGDSVVTVEHFEILERKGSLH